MGWKIYFWVLFLLLIIAYAMILTTSPTFWDILDPIVSFVALAGVFAYAYKKKIFSANFWKTWFVVIIIWDLTYNIVLTEYLGVAQDIGSSLEEGTPIDHILSILIIIPEYIALYLLGVKSPDIWNK